MKTERLYPADISCIAKDFQEFATIMSWFDLNMQINPPEDMKNPIGGQIGPRLYAFYSETQTYPGAEEVCRIATDLIEQVWEFPILNSERAPITHASRVAAEGRPNAAKASLELNNTEIDPGTKEQILAVAHLVEAIHEGLDEDEHIHNQPKKALDHFDTGIMYLARAIELKAHLYENETAKTA